MACPIFTGYAVNWFIIPNWSKLWWCSYSCTEIAAALRTTTCRLMLLQGLGVTRVVARRDSVVVQVSLGFCSGTCMPASDIVISDVCVAVFWTGGLVSGIYAPVSWNICQSAMLYNAAAVAVHRKMIFFLFTTLFSSPKFLYFEHELTTYLQYFGLRASLII